MYSMKIIRKKGGKEKSTGAHEEGMKSTWGRRGGKERIERREREEKEGEKRKEGKDRE